MTFSCESKSATSTVGLLGADGARSDATIIDTSMIASRSIPMASSVISFACSPRARLPAMALISRASCLNVGLGASRTAQPDLCFAILPDDANKDER